MAKEIYSFVKSKNGKFVSCVQVDVEKVSTYPDEFDTVEEGFEEAAKLALEGL